MTTYFVNVYIGMAVDDNTLLSQVYIGMAVDDNILHTILYRHGSR